MVGARSVPDLHLTSQITEKIYQRQVTKIGLSDCEFSASFLKTFLTYELQH